MSVLRFLLLALSAALMVVLTNCSTTPNGGNTAAPNQASTPVASNASPMPHSMGTAKININTAILSELDKLEAKLGVPALSNKIQASRPYGSVDELVAKQVVTPDQLNQIRDMVTVEDVVLTGEAKDVDYMLKLGLMKGHLLVAKELIDLGKPDQAEPHIGHPVEEIYVDVEDQLRERNVKEFKTTLIKLQDLLKANPKDAKVASQFETAMQAVDTAIQALPASQRQSPEFALKVIDGLLDAAATEYAAAVANGKIAAVIEYQDSRGFVTYSNSLYSSVTDQVAKQYPEAHKAITTTFSELLKTWPSAIAPSTPVNTPTQVAQWVKAIEQSSQPVTVAKQ